MSVWEVVEDDYGFDQWFQIGYSDGTAVDLTGYTASLVMWSGEGLSRATKATMSGTLDGTPSTGKVKFTPGATDFNTPGIYYFTVKLSTGSLEFKTMPCQVRVIEGAT
jgi:hypothetical protein